MSIIFKLQLVLCFLVSLVFSSTSTGSNVIVLDYNDLKDGKDLTDEIESAFGKSGLGILTVKNVPDFQKRRMELLPLARRFALLDDDVKKKYEDEKSFYSFGWSHGKEKLQGKPDSSKGSYYANPLYDTVTDDPAIMKEYPDFANPNIWPKQELPELEPAFKHLGKLITDVGVLVAQQCDAYVRKCHPNYTSNKLSSILSTSKCAKARLLHYYARNDKDTCVSNSKSVEEEFSDWCGWHNDHGSLTGLTPAVFMDNDGNIVANNDKNAGLYIRNRASEIVKVSIPADHIAFQIGECSQIHTGGALQATPHAVRGSNVPGVSRETFAVFMEPMWDEPMRVPDGVSPEEAQSQSAAAALPQGVPPLSRRWSQKMSFGEFTKSTLKEYY
jgi:isopenicillin N synthase-like dioxygenase